MRMSIQTLLLTTSVLFLFVISFSAAAIDNLPIISQATNSTGGVINQSVTMAYIFNLTTSTNCASAFYTNSTTLTTDSRGIITYTLTNVPINFSQFHLCLYRDGALQSNSTVYRKNNLSQFNNDINNSFSANSSANIGNIPASQVIYNNSNGGWNATFNNLTVTTLRILTGAVNQIPYLNSIGILKFISTLTFDDASGTAIANYFQASTAFKYQNSVGTTQSFAVCNNVTLTCFGTAYCSGTPSYNCAQWNDGGGDGTACNNNPPTNVCSYDSGTGVCSNNACSTLLSQTDCDNAVCASPGWQVPSSFSDRATCNGAGFDWGLSAGCANNQWYIVGQGGGITTSYT